MGRPEIIAAARQCFSSHPYDSVTMTQIAGKVQIKAPSLYAHFSSKEAIYQAVFDNIVDDHLAYFTGLLGSSAGLDPLARLRHALTGIQRYYAERPELIGFHLRAAVDVDRTQQRTLESALERTDAELARFVEAAYREGLASGEFRRLDPRAFTSLFTCLMDGVFLQMAYYPAAEHDALFEDVWRALVGLLTTNGEVPRGDIN